MQLFIERLKKILTLSREDLVPAGIVFVVIVGAAVLGQFLSIAFNTSPVIIWAPSGIAFAAVIIFGSRIFIPIACAFLVASIFCLWHAPFSVVLAAMLVQTTSPFIGAYFLKQLGFTKTFNSLRETFSFVLVAIVLSVFEASLIVFAQSLAHSLTADPLTGWSSQLAGRLLSILVITPLVVAWFPWRGTSLTTSKARTEASLALLAIILTSYILFWTSLAVTFSFIFDLALLVALFWVALRLNIRKMMIAIFVITVFGIAGAFLAPQNLATPLSEHLLSIQLFVVLIAPIFLGFSALSKEREVATKALEVHVQHLEDAMVKLSTEDEAKNEFLAILAHELRNPLATILSTIELMTAQGTQAKDTPDLLKVVDQRVHAMATLLDDLLDISRISRNKFKLEKKLVSLIPILENSLLATRTYLNSRGHTLTVSLPEQDIFLLADTTRLEQIVINLLNNAIKYTEPMGAIELSARTEGDTAIIRVRDSGIGIPRYMLARIFEPFFQIKRAGKQAEGLGIGLSLARQLVEMHGGTIEAHSKGEGTSSEFIVRLPIPPRTPAVIAQEKKKASEVIKPAPAPKDGLKVLVVDDNQAAADSLSQLLTLRGYKTVVAYNGAEGFEKAVAFRPQVAILDIGMPDLDGYEVAGLLREEKLPCTYVALTGYGQIHDKKKALHAGFDYHLTKPAGLKEIEGILRKVAYAMKNKKATV